MAYVDPNDNILKWENGDVVTPQAVKMNMHLDSVGTVTNALRRRGTYTVNNIPERTALVNTIGASNISNSNPLMVWRANADAGKRLEYTENGGTWHYVKTSQDVNDTGWVNITSITPQAGEHFQYRVKDGVVFISSRYLRNIAAGTLLNPMYTIPAAIYPAKTIAGSCYGGGARPATGHVGATGNVNIRNDHTATVNEMLFDVSYPLN